MDWPRSGAVVDDGAWSRGSEGWIAQRLLAGDSGKAVALSLSAAGADESAAEKAVAAVVASPVFQIARQEAGRRRKLASLMDTLGRQARQAPAAGTIPVEEAPIAETFFDQYYFQNRPVVLKELMRHWPALRRWSPEYFADRFGDVEVEITDDREADPRYEDNFTVHRRTVTVRRFVEGVLGRPGNDSYAVAKNRWLQNPDLATLKADFAAPEILRAEEDAVRAPSLWFGPAGTVTPLHHDSTNILFGQVYGRKLVRLIAPYYMERVYNDRLCFSAVDLDAVDFDSFPDMRDVLVLEATVGPGDFIFLPVGWWHWVRSLDVSISISFQAFAVAGRPVVWHQPDMD